MQDGGRFVRFFKNVTRDDLETHQIRSCTMVRTGPWNQKSFSRPWKPMISVFDPLKSLNIPSSTLKPLKTWCFCEVLVPLTVIMYRSLKPLNDSWNQKSHFPGLEKPLTFVIATFEKSLNFSHPYFKNPYKLGSSVIYPCTMYHDPHMFLKSSNIFEINVVILQALKNPWFSLSTFKILEFSHQYFKTIQKLVLLGYTCASYDIYTRVSYNVNKPSKVVK